VVCYDKNIKATKKKRDDSLWYEDVVEVFIREQKFKKTKDFFFEYQVSPLGTMMDCMCLKPYTGVLNWNSKGWKAAVTVNGTVNKTDDKDKSWTVEMAIPFVDLHAQVFLSPNPNKFCPKSGDTLRMNIIRIDYKNKKPVDAYWSPIYNMDRHDRHRDGILYFY
jgi:hypothetical protein